ncbi:FAD-dependent oxidoreductase [Eilatimonas milleporae]|uniref:Thioredoxin reductase n=1 Tax=Eilatimonas milleporae TaxID=911205 RepID=A0A3M0C1H9_9PROT|nr:FAD-dependent oxidoreductase [Eilatimonas milleporae]RMB00676.1 thioredoxin reductase (NADPH) [Eilatimonas milleporae]
MTDDSPAIEAVRRTAGASDPYAREQQTFPVLNDEQVARVSEYGRTEDLPKGAVLFERGQRGVDFFLILDGTVEIYDLDDQGRPVIITTHRKHQFTGELDLFNQRKILVGGRTGTASRIVRLNRDQFRRMAGTEADIGEIMMRAFILRRSAFIVHSEAGVTLLGTGADRDTIRISRFLTRNGYPVDRLDPDTPEAAAFAEACGLSPEDARAQAGPVLRTPDGQVFRNPTTPELADQLGLTEELDPAHVYDLAVVGGGPAGLSACVYGASEALDTIVIEAEAPGGQAGTSSRIENYLGFPTGISGQALAARAWIQGQKFGARFAIARGATGIRRDGTIFTVTTEGDMPVRARAVILASGATYRRLALENYETYEGQGIHYAATALEAQFCKGSDIIVVGGGNSAGQAAVFLSGHARHVHILVRGDGLAASMSDYLVQRIDQSRRITLHCNAELTRLEGDRMLRRATWTDRRTGENVTKDISNIFVMIGAVPNTAWMGDCVDLDDKGFVLTGAGVCKESASPFQTSVPGIFAVGDVRSGSVKRVASGVGEGSVCISAVHAYLAAHPVDPS